jgi:hypothetical protein
LFAKKSQDDLISATNSCGSAAVMTALVEGVSVRSGMTENPAGLRRMPARLPRYAGLILLEDNRQTSRHCEERKRRRIETAAPPCHAPRSV